MKEKRVGKIVIAKETKTKKESEKIEKMKKEFQDAIVLSGTPYFNSFTILNFGAIL